MEDREVSAFNCQTSSLLQHRLICQLCQDHLFLSFINPFLMEMCCLTGDGSYAESSPGRCPVYPAQEWPFIREATTQQP